MIGRWPIYQPLAFFIWWFKFDAYAPVIFVQGACIAASGGIAAVVIAIVLSVWRAREARHVTTYGSARWADAREIRRAGLLGADGVVLGRFDGRYLRHNGPEHVLCFAPTRSGKGVGLVIPTLFDCEALLHALSMLSSVVASRKAVVSLLGNAKHWKRKQ
jgi:type IV secretion system protein VirD4